MSDTSVTTMLGNTFARGIHPPECKQFAEDAAIEVLPTPAQIRIPLLQHLGAPCEAIVKPKVEVAVGEMVGNVDAFVSAPVHSSWSRPPSKVVV